MSNIWKKQEEVQKIRTWEVHHSELICSGPKSQLKFDSLKKFCQLSMEEVVSWSGLFLFIEDTDLWATFPDVSSYLCDPHNPKPDLMGHLRPLEQV